jgi:hypothetical protein
MAVSGVACGEIPLPEPAPRKVRREPDDWIKPGRDVHLRGIELRLGLNGIRVRNGEEFTLTLVDDVWLSVIAPNADVRTEGPYVGKWHDVAAVSSLPNRSNYSGGNGSRNPVRFVRHYDL